MPGSYSTTTTGLVRQRESPSPSASSLAAARTSARHLRRVRQLLRGGLCACSTGNNDIAARAGCYSCGGNGASNGTACGCHGDFIGELCDTVCGLRPHGNLMGIGDARAVGDSAAGHCACHGDFIGEFCETECGSLWQPDGHRVRSRSQLLLCGLMRLRGRLHRRVLRDREAAAGTATRRPSEPCAQIHARPLLESEGTCYQDCGRQSTGEELNASDDEVVWTVTSVRRPGLPPQTSAGQTTKRRPAHARAASSLCATSWTRPPRTSPAQIPASECDGGLYTSGISSNRQHHCSGFSGCTRSSTLHGLVYARRLLPRGHLHHGGRLLFGGLVRVRGQLHRRVLRDGAAAAATGTRRTSSPLAKPSPAAGSCACEGDFIGSSATLSAAARESVRILTSRGRAARALLVVAKTCAPPMSTFAGRQPRSWCYQW